MNRIAICTAAMIAALSAGTMLVPAFASDETSAIMRQLLGNLNRAMELSGPEGTLPEKQAKAEVVRLLRDTSKRLSQVKRHESIMADYADDYSRAVADLADEAESDGIRLDDGTLRLEVLRVVRLCSGCHSHLLVMNERH